ncbi:MAG: hypothetical protein A3F84_17735 [Candidatus Handelsmanbacteria bacterium RIFCSPLOWO2_12_FULL_64_10]|uniref:Uncharacterized protein n=1 Tax=Handelsmanbacteria sp. (strain RIFCSPLOWO2_12_FULL_64_10) TaxID=1817868 RepID=A0A1F6CR32_HANXR|nr:MAG: hypothetical protein A3F84_17735 [Candidatus Handelsmanbacteria bacterium RIFCSPLOWO2_12_FULL_64_10]
MSERMRWGVVALFAVVMAWMEAATVVYLRTLVGRVDPYQAVPLPMLPHLTGAELVREVATLVMLFTVGCLAGRTWRSRLGYTIVAFGVWDILYYLFLRVIVGWPRSIWDWDVLFLLPLPWWGPVIAPVLIAGMMVLGGTLVSQFDRPGQPVWPGRLSWALNVAGVFLALYAFMADAIGALDGGVEAVRAVLPVRFNWPLFLVALVLMAAPIVDMSRQIWKKGP